MSAVRAAMVAFPGVTLRSSLCRRLSLSSRKLFRGPPAAQPEAVRRARDWSRGVYSLALETLGFHEI